MYKSWMWKQRSFRDQHDNHKAGTGGGGTDDKGTDDKGDKGTDDKSGDDKGDKSGDDKGDKGTDDKGDKKPTDEEAKLLKEVMQKKEALKKTEENLAAAQARLAEFDGVDPNEIKKLLADRKAAEEAQLAARGEFDTLKARMADEHTKAMKGVQDENATLKEQIAALNRTVEDLSIGAQFAQSKFIADELTLTPSKARTIYGAHFDTVDGAVVAYDKPRGAAGRTPLVDQYGNNVGFEDALKKLVDADADRESLLRSKVKPGSGSDSRQTRQAQQTQKPAASVDKIASGLAKLNLFPGQ